MHTRVQERGKKIESAAAMVKDEEEGEKKERGKEVRTESSPPRYTQTCVRNTASERES